ncbi:penicillin-binding transpeptidase domain-containing protein [Paenibacillus yanchengensis]|uniref:Penicillin-binding transpeptidase domain-containing protein n=1 Tax=Paenibacillus yanchengensis TaxID=2035833 RepID=A0ABW4YKL7_9BACL
MLRKIRLRTLLFGGLFTLLFVILIGRIFYVQIVNGDQWHDMAKNIWSTAEVLPAKRGEITDRDGNILAMDTIAYNVMLNPKMINESEIVDDVTEGLAEILETSKSNILEQLTAKRENGNYYVQRELRKDGWQIDKEKADKIKEFSAELNQKVRDKKKNGLLVQENVGSGIYLEETLKRYYPKRKRASHILGYMTLDRDTKTGLEYYFDEQLTGEDGYIHYLKDGMRVQLSQGEVDYKSAKDGDRIMLTIDNDIQNYAEEALKEVVKKHDPKSATAIVLDPKTMEILAMANTPDFDPNEYWEGESYNHAVRSLYEPGSTFKIMTLAAAVEEGQFDPEETYMSGRINVPGGTISEHNKVGWGQITFLEGVKYSSNVAFVKMGYERLGKEKLKEYYANFGFGQKTGIDLGGELPGTIDFHWPRDVASATFGQGVVQVTPLQQAVAVAAVANGGKLYKPQIIKEITDMETNTTTVREPEFVRQVVSEKTSKLVNEYLEQVVSDQQRGTGRHAYIEGFRVAGKTGTAQKAAAGKSGYSENKFVVSFIGYAPVEDPQIVVYVVVDEPSGALAGGGSVAAPAFKEIMLNSLRKMGVQPNYDTGTDQAGKKEASVIIPDVTKKKVAHAREQVKGLGMNFEIIGTGTSVVKQVPAAKTVAHPTQKVYLITEQEENLGIPDLTGASLRDALEISSIVGVKLVVQGEGYIVSQQEIVENNVRQLKIVLAPPAGSEAAEYYVDPTDEVPESEEDSEAGEEEQVAEEEEAIEESPTEESSAPAN